MSKGQWLNCKQQHTFTYVFSPVICYGIHQHFVTLISFLTYVCVQLTSHITPPYNSIIIQYEYAILQKLKINLHRYVIMRKGFYLQQFIEPIH